MAAGPADEDHAERGIPFVIAPCDVEGMEILTTERVQQVTKRAMAMKTKRHRSDMTLYSACST